MTAWQPFSLDKLRKTHRTLHAQHQTADSYLTVTRLDCKVKKKLKRAKIKTGVNSGPLFTGRNLLDSLKR